MGDLSPDVRYHPHFVTRRFAGELKTEREKEKREKHERFSKERREIGEEEVVIVAVQHSFNPTDRAPVLISYSSEAPVHYTCID